MASDNYNDILRKNINLKNSPRNREVVSDDMISPEIDDTDESLQFFKDLGINDIQGDLSKDKNFDKISTLLTKKQKDTINKKLTTVRNPTKRVITDVRSYFDQANGVSNLSIPDPDYLSSDDEEKKKGSSKNLDTRSKSDILNRMTPIYNLPEDITYIYGLDSKILNDLRMIARIEIDCLFDKYSISWVRYKAKRSKESGIFNVSLNNLLNHDIKKDQTLRVPLFFLKIIEKLNCCCDEEGILRIPGSVSRIRELRRELDNSWKNKLESILKESSVADLCGLLKQFLKDLPSSLLTHQFMDAYPNVLKISDTNDMIYGFQLLNLVLPDVHRSCFQILMRLLHCIINNPNNKMSIENVATIMGPNLFVSSKSKGSEFELFGSAVQVILKMLKIDEYLWIVPEKLIQQIRKKYNKKLGYKSLLDESCTEIFKYMTVFVDNDPQKRLSISIDMQSTVTNVLDKIINEPFMVSKDSITLKNLRLFEFGGNINYRLLCKTANIHSIITANPRAKFYAISYSAHRLVTRWPKTFEPIKS